MYILFEVNTGWVVEEYQDERLAWSLAYGLNDEYAESHGLEYSVKRKD